MTDGVQGRLDLTPDQALARLETRIVFEELLAAIPEWELADGAVRAGSGQVRGHEHLPIEFPV